MQLFLARLSSHYLIFWNGQESISFVFICSFELFKLIFHEHIAIGVQIGCQNKKNFNFFSFFLTLCNYNKIIASYKNTMSNSHEQGSKKN